eukprot:COSAG01_NODE_8839_length_2641_cov_1.638080_2_plen_179_part_00
MSQSGPLYRTAGGTANMSQSGPLYQTAGGTANMSQSGPLDQTESDGTANAPQLVAWAKVHGCEGVASHLIGFGVTAPGEIEGMAISSIEEVAQKLPPDQREKFVSVPPVRQKLSSGVPEPEPEPEPEPGGAVPNHAAPSPGPQDGLLSYVCRRLCGCCPFAGGTRSRAEGELHAELVS